MYKVEFTEKLLEVSANKTVISSAIRQKGESQNILQENEAHQIFRKINISTPLYAHVRVRIRR